MIRRIATVATLVLIALACGDGRPSVNGTPPALVERVVAPRRATEGTSPPLLVLLHGIGANENDLLPLAGQLDPRLLVVSVRAPRPYQRGWAWFQLDFRDGGEIVPNLEQAHETLGDLVRWLQTAPGRLGADGRRVYLLGFSQGGMMSLAVLHTAPELVAGVVALSTRFGDRLVRAPADAAAVSRVPVFVAHGASDTLLPIGDGRAIRDRLQPLLRDFTYREYPTGHTIAPDEIRDVAAWLTTRLDR